MARPTLEEMQARAAAMRQSRVEKRSARAIATQIKPIPKIVDPEPEPLRDPTDLVNMQEHTWLGAPGKSLYIPSWYKTHDKNYEVRDGAKKMGFRVGDVMPHRRWAIKPDGVLLDQRDFEPLYEQYISEIVSRDIDPKNQHIPRVERYVNQKPDPSGGPGFVAIGFDPNAKPAVEDNGVRYDPVKDVIFSIKEDLERSSRLERIEALSQMLIRKEISGETFEREMRSMAPQIEFIDLEPKAEPEQEATQPVA